VFTENTISEVAVMQPPSESGKIFPNYEQFITPCVVDGKMYTLDNISFVPKENRNFSSILVGSKNVTVPDQCMYGVYGIYVLSLRAFLISALVGNCTVPSYINFGSSTTVAN
jgi:hypothetical protein